MGDSGGKEVHAHKDAGRYRDTRIGEDGVSDKEHPWNHHCARGQNDNGNGVLSFSKILCDSAKCSSCTCDGIQLHTSFQSRCTEPRNLALNSSNAGGFAARYCRLVECSVCSLIWVDSIRQVNDKVNLPLRKSKRRCAGR